MTVLEVAVLGGVFGIGVALVVAALAGRDAFNGIAFGALRERLDGKVTARLAGAVAVALGTVAVTGWLVGGALTGLGAFMAPRLLGGRRARQVAVARTEAIASWTEMIRDSMAAASGLEEAIKATAEVSPRAIRPEVRLLEYRLDHQRLPDALVAFGEEVAHPSADMVVAALVIAASMEASDLTGLLSRLADSIRDEARMRVRVEVGRTSVRTSATVILAVFMATGVLLALFSRDYLSPYDGAGGQLMLLVVGAIFALGGWLMAKMADLEMPERFRARTAGRAAR